MTVTGTASNVFRFSSFLVVVFKYFVGFVEKSINLLPEPLYLFSSTHLQEICRHASVPHLTFDSTIRLADPFPANN